jgi:hypothetical protein
MVRHVAGPHQGTAIMADTKKKPAQPGGKPTKK